MHNNLRTIILNVFYNESSKTVSLISSDPPCKNGNTEFTTVPLKALADSSI